MKPSEYRDLSKDQEYLKQLKFLEELNSIREQIQELGESPIQRSSSDTEAVWLEKLKNQLFEAITLRGEENGNK